jgi:hypothetical protein
MGHQKKNNVRRIAKGRPELYNWVRNFKRELAELYSEYRTQTLRKCAVPKTELCEVKETINIGLEREYEGYGRPRRMSLAERFKKL